MKFKHRCFPHLINSLYKSGTSRLAFTMFLNVKRIHMSNEDSFSLQAYYNRTRLVMMVFFPLEKLVTRETLKASLSVEGMFFLERNI